MTANIKKIGFLLIDGFTMMAFSNVIEPLRMANYVSSQPVYSWIISGFAGHQTSASNGYKSLIPLKSNIYLIVNSCLSAGAMKPKI